MEIEITSWGRINFKGIFNRSFQFGKVIRTMGLGTLVFYLFLNEFRVHEIGIEK